MLQYLLRSAAAHNPKIEQGLVIFFIITGARGFVVPANLTRESEPLLNVGGALFYTILCTTCVKTTGDSSL
jgi:hypothetical protein